MIRPYPLRFRPLLKQTLWGGRLLGERLGKTIGNEADYAESWEIVDHDENQSVVESGELAGMTLHRLLTESPEWLLGTSVKIARFPLLLKYLDCNRVLSVQVHPDDAYAANMSTPDLGKTEAWYIVESKPGSLVYAGLKSGVTRSDFREAIEQKRADDVLHTYHPSTGDCLFIPAGTVHALGEGLLVAEIQQSSDTTFRLFDWNRVDASGEPRTLHINQGLEVTDFDRGPIDPVRANGELSEWQSLVECEKFVLCACVNNGSNQVKVSLGGDSRFHIVTVPCGNATLAFEADSTTLRAGDSVLLPASMPTIEISVSRDTTVLSAHVSGQVLR